jgi:BlaI family penicillinase repressor
MKLSEAEWQIMNALWKRHPATARDLMEFMPKDNNWAYTTVKTMLTRLVAKKAIAERKRGNTSVYDPLISQQSARKNAMRTFVDKVFGGTVEPIMHFLIEEKKLSDKDRRQLIDMLEEMDQSTREVRDGSNQ